MLYHLFINNSSDILVSHEPFVEGYARVYSIEASSWDEAYYKMVSSQRDVLKPVEYKEG